MRTDRRHRNARLRLHRALKDVYPVEQLEQRFMLSGSPNLSLLQANLNSTFTDANNVIQNTISATPLPLVGSKIGSEIKTLTNLQSTFNTALGSITSSSTAAQVQSALQTALPGATVTIVQNSSSVDEFTVSQNIPSGMVANTSSLSFNLGLPALSMNGSIGLNVSLGSVYTLDFGVNNTSGFFLSTTNTSFNFNTSTTIAPGSTFNGSFGILALTGTDYTGDPDSLGISSTLMTADYTATLAAPGGATTLTTATLPNMTTNMTLGGNAHLALNANFQAASGMASSFPSLKAVLTLDWNFPSSALTSAGIATANFGDDPELGLNNLSVDLGSAINNILDPVLTDIDKVLKPIKPIVDFLNGPMPLFNDVGFLKSIIAEQIPGGLGPSGECTVGDFFVFLANLDGEGPEAQSVNDFAQYVGQFYTLYSAVSSLNGVTQGLPLGSFTIGGDSDDTLQADLRLSSSVTNLNFSNIAMGSGVQGDIQSYLDGIGGSDIYNEIFPSSGISSVPVNATFGNNNQYSFDNNTADFGFHFPLLTNPGSALGILFGQDVNLFTFTTPPMDFGVPFEVNIPVFGPLVICLKGNLDNNNDAVLFGGQFSMGYDTYGLTHTNPTQNPGGALDGFYINDSDSFAEASFGIAADAAVDLLIVEAGVGGGIEANVVLSMNDPEMATDGGKLRYDQIQTDLQNGPLGLFAFGGELTASLNAFVQIGWPPFGWEDSVNFATITLLDFTTEAPAPDLGTDVGGIVTLNFNASNADTSGADKGLDNYTITDLGAATGGGEVIDVNGDGGDEIFGAPDSGEPGVTEITGEGENQGFSLHVEPGVTAPLDIAGGYFPTDPDNQPTDNKVQINDQGSGAATIYGSDGNDNIRVATPGSNGSQGAIIYGGNVYPGNPSISQDVIEADGALVSGGENSITGGTADETIIGGPGNDYINVGNAATALVDAGGNSTIIGGTGSDHFVVNFANQATDTIQANAAGSNLLQVDGAGGGETITAFYQSGALNVDSSDAGTNVSVMSANIQTLDIEPAPGLSTSSLAIPGQPSPTLPTPAAGSITVNVNSLNGSGLKTLFVNILGSTSGASQVNPINVNVAGFGNDSVSVTGTYGSLNQSNSQVNNASEVYEITSSQAAGGLTIFTTDGPTDTLTYNAGTGSNSFALQNQIVNPGQITFNSLQASPGSDTYNIDAVVGATTIDQDGKNDLVFIGSSEPGGLSLIQAPVSITGTTGTLALTVTDATGTVGGTGAINQGVISGFDLGSNTISWTYATSLDVTLGNHGNTANVDLTTPIPVTIQAGNGGDNIQASSSTIPMTLLGGTGNDTIAASNNGDYINGGTGNNLLTEGVLLAHEGDDTIIGGPGSNHIIDDGAVGLIYGNDVAADGLGGANLITGTAEALIYTGPGQDTVTFTGEADDTVIAQGGNDLISLGDGADSVYGAGGNDTITTGNGMDTILAGNGSDSITTGNGGDRITIGNGNSTITTGSGDDIILVGNGNDQITSGAGDDIIDIGTGSDVVNGGPGTNTLVQSADASQVLTDNTLVSVGTTDFSNIQHVSLFGQTSAHDFTVSGWTNPGSVELTGGSGTNTVTSTDDTNFTLNNSTLSRSDGTLFGLSNIQNAMLTGGNSSDTFDVSGWTGTATLNGGGSLGLDTVIANDNSNMTLAAATLSRPGFGLVTLVDIVRAVLTGNVGNLLLDASAFAGQATLVAGPGNDTLLAGTGGDYLSGGTGHDSLVSSSGRDIIVATSGAGDTINTGTGGDIVYSTNAADVINGTPASLNPSIAATGPTYSVPAASLPSGGDSIGPWAQFSGSASAGGVSSTTGAAIDPAVVAGSGAQYVAWADNRSGTYEIYVAEHVGGAWQQLAGSDQGGGISNSVGNSLRPSIALDNSGNPVVAWTEYNGTSTDICLADYSGGAWVALGTSLSAGGISNTGAADNAKIVETSSGPVVTWLNTNSGITNVYAKRYSGGSWSALGAGGASGAGVTNSATSVTAEALATDGTNVALAWSSNSFIYLLEFTGTAWVAVNASASGTGVSGISGAAEPTVAISGGHIYVAWQETAGTAETISAATNAGGSGWQALATQALATSDTIADNYGAASNPQLASGGSTLDLTWMQTTLGVAGAFTTSLDANQFNGSAFTDQIPGDSEIEGIGQSLSTVSSLALAVDPNGYAYAAWGDSTSGVPQIYLRGNASSIPSVYYVNGTYSATDVFTTASGASGNTGLSPSSPLNSVQAVLSKYSLVAGDVIMVDNGSYAGFTLTTSGISIIGAGGAGAHFTSAVTISSASNINLEGLYLDGGISITSSSNIEVRAGTAASVTVTGGSNVRLDQELISGGITLTGGTSSPYIEGNTITASTGIAITGSGATGVDIVNNTINATSGIILAGTTQGGTISYNNINASGTGLAVSIAGFTGAIDYNEIHGGSVGVNYNASAPLNANQIFGNSTGVIDSVNSSTGGLGFVGTPIANNIFQNTVGVQLTGLMQDQHVYSNTTGVTGSGTLGGTALNLANNIETNATGVNFNGTIQYNRLDHNTLTVVAAAGQLIAHNLILNNAVNGLEISGVSDVRIINNTFYSTSGDNVLLDNASSNVQLLDNIMESTGGYDLYVNSDSRTGFFSDYNDLYTTGTGKIVHWLVDFTDILSWQNALGLYDQHSIGSASINPNEGNPNLVAPANGDLRILPFVNGIRSTSPATGTADPALDIGLPTSYTNLLLNNSFENGVTSWTVNTGGTTASGTPPAFNGSSYFYAGAVASGFAEQTISLSSYASQINAQTLSLEFGGRIRAGVETISSEGQIILTFMNSSGGVIGTPVTLSASNVNNRWELVSSRVNIPVGALSVEYEFTATRETGTADDSYLDNAFVYVTANTTAPDMGAYGYTAADVSLVKAEHLHLISPDLYVNWVLNSPHTIQWASYGNTTGSQVEISLYQNGSFLMTIAASTPDTGSYVWIPTSPLTYGTYGLQIEISLVGNSAVYDRSTETFSIPENGNTYYINDVSTTGDQYTTAVGNDRATGKLPSSPLPLLTTLLREYSLSGSNTVYIDNGTYEDFAPVELSSNPALGNGSGITIIGPTNTGDSATINADGFTSPAVIDVTDAGNVKLSHLALDGANYGVWVRNASTGFNASYLTASGNLLGGIRIESDSSASVTLANLLTTNNTGDGLYVGGVFTSLTNSTSANNTGDGFDLANAGGVVLTGDVAYGNATGLSIANTYNDPTSTVGNMNLSAGAGNLFYNNTGDGIDASGPVLIAGNTVYNNSNGIGINLTSTGASATENIVFGNKTGIQTDSSALSVTYNRVYSNSGAGIEGDSGAIVTDNLTYSNSVGIESNTYQGTGPDIANNLVYGNSTQGIWVLGGGTGATIDNNTVYQSVGDAILLDLSGGIGGSNIHLDDDILWTSGAYDIALNPLSEVGFTSDYNDLYVTGTGAVGLRENISEPTLAAWLAAGGTDADSISTNPEFVNAAGGDFHPQSSTGSFHGGSLAPSLNVTTNLPQANPGTLTADPNQSPTIDRGDPTAPYSNEPAPNGGVVNMGSFGDTAQASLSLSSYVLVARPSGGILLEGQTFNITWRSQDTQGTVNINLLQNGSSVLTIATGAPNSGTYSWSIPTTITPGSNFTIQVTRNTTPAVGVSAAFTLDSAVQAFYVNGSATGGSATFAGGTFNVSAGNDANSGLDPADPKATLQALLTEYSFTSGDIIYVDAATYNLSSNVILTATDNGITIEGVTSGGTIFDRTNDATGSYDFDLQGATGVTLENVSITGGFYGINASSGEGSTNLTVNASAFYGDYQAGIDLAAGNGGATITNSIFHDMSGPFGLNGIIVTNNDVTITGNTFYNLSSYGINLTTGDNSTISLNRLYNDGTGISEDTATVSGNIAYHDTIGISAGGTTNVSGNTLYNDSTGITIGAGIATGNIAYNNSVGINTSGIETVSYNLLFNNTAEAIATGNGATLLGNVAYGNGWGMTVSSYPSGATGGPIIENNLLYDNTSGGIDMAGGDTVPILNNTIYQTGGVGFEVTNYDGLTAHGVALRDNIFWNTAGPDIQVDPSDETGMAFDYNDLYATGTGEIGIWGATPATTLAQWQATTSNDPDSISTDPQFVNVAGGDFHLQSSSGSFHGGTLAPVLNVTTGLPQANPGVLTDDVNYSPGINAGSPADPYSNEPSPNGGYVDLGSYGNSAQASLSKAHYLTVIRPLAGQSVVAGSATPITWRDEVSNTATGPTDTVDFAVLPTGSSTPVQTFTGPDTGSYSWTPSANLSAGTYTIEITRTDGTGLNASSAVFNIAGQTHIYYVATTGSDSNSGLNPANPKATIGGVLSAGYTFDPGDTIEVAAGTYNVSSNIALVAADSGIIIAGVASGGTILNRGSLSSGSYIFSMLGATNITLQNLTFTDAYVAVNANYGNTSTGLTVTGCTFTGEQYIGIELGGENGTSTVTNCTFSNFIQQNYGGSTGVYLYSHDIITLTGNTASGMSEGFYLQGIDGGTISNNNLFNNTYGIEVSASGVGPVSVTSNIAYDNAIDLDVSGPDLTASGNTAYKDSHASSSIIGNNQIGIYLTGAAVVTANNVYGNATGIDSGGGQFGADIVSDNLVYNNTGVGISGGDGDTTTGNIVYDNGTWGIQYSLGYGTAATIANNLVYGNTTGGIDLVGAYETQVLNNTVYQTTGNAFELDGSPTANPDGLTVENNIFWAASTTATGYAVQFADSAAYSFVSDYNDLYATGNGQIAKESTQGFATLSAWVWELGQDVHSISADPQFVSITGSNFNVSSTSPTIDAGNPASAFSLEPAPNGGRINLGYTGDTAQATPSPAQEVQVLFPSGTLKLQDGIGYTITWQSAGLSSGTTATVALSIDGGNTWTQLATNVAMNSSGGGTLAWTPSVTTTGATGLIRVTASSGQVGVSSLPFSLASAGTAFYVSTTGNNANSGTSASAPMSSIEAVLNSYHPGTGDTIYVAGGTYTLFHDIVIGPADTGLTITGPTSGAAAVLNRNSTTSGDYGFSLLDGANNITIENLSITGAPQAIYAPSKQDLGNSNITILNNVLYANGLSGYFGGIFTADNSNWVISGNTIHDNVGFYGGIYLQDCTATITGNTIYNETAYGIYFSTPVYNTVIASNVVSGNTVSFCGTGIEVSQATVSNNVVEGCTTAGLYVSGDSVVTGNTAWGQTATNAVGINVEDAFVSNNLVYDNYNGIYSGGGNAEIFDNRVYSNTDYGLYISGMNGANADLGPDYIATAYNNLVYANVVGGIYLTGNLDFTLINNTVYQVTGNAITNSGTLNATYPLTFRNNVLYVESGYDIDIPSSPAGGLISDYNVLYHSGSADVGIWNGSTGATLAAWQSLSSLDAHSSEANPLFVDPAGADGVLGYNPSGNNGAGYNGGSDDNFTLSRTSPAIDDGFSAGAPTTDLLGEPRVDDPGTPNTGSLMTVITNTGSNQFVANSGVAQNWNGYNDFWTLTFPAGFTFPFYGTSYSSVNVSSNGFLEFNGENLGNGNSDTGLTRYPVIAPMWEYLTTSVISGDGSNIFVDTSVANQVTIRWKATIANQGTAPINFAVVLFSNGNMRFDYGAGNTGLSPTIGLSAGDGLNNYYLSYDGAATLTNANSILVTILQNGYVDRGAYEFQGSSLNTTPPTVTAISPPAIESSGAVIGAVSTITVTFSEPMNPIDASAPGEYILTGSNSATYVLTPQYTIGSNQVVLSIAGGQLPNGTYTFTIVGTSPNGIHDTSGNLLDGNGNGSPGSNYVSNFSVTAAQPVSLTGSASYYLRLDSDGQHVDVWNSSTDTGSYSEQLTPSQISALTITASGGAGTFIIDNSNGNVIPAIGVTLVGDGATSLQIIGSGAGDTITANAGQIVYDGVLLNFSGTTQTTLNPNGGTDTLAVNAGTLLLAAPLPGSGLTVRRFSSITVANGAELQVLTPASHGDRALIVTSTLSIAGSAGHWTGTLDLGGNDLDVQGGSLSTLTNELAQGYNNGHWNGGGVDSSAAASDTTHLTALGSMQNNQGGSPIFGTGAGESLFDGVSPGASDLLVKFTYYGDANLDGKVDASDYSRIDNGYLTGATGWYNGDFNYDGVVNGSDYTLIDNAFNMQGSNLNLGPSYYLKLDADGQHIDIWNNATGTGSYAQQVLRSQASTLTLTSTTGSGSFTVDNSAGDIYVAGGLTLTGDGNTSLRIIGTGGVDTVTATAGQLIFDGNALNVSGINVTTFTGNIDLPANALVISNGITYQSTGTLNLLEAGNASLSQPAINMSSGATLQLIGTTNSASSPDIFFGPDSSGSAYFGPQILGGTLNLGSTQRFIESNSGHNSVAKYLLPSYDVDSLITSTIIGTAGFNYQGNEESTSGFYADLVLTGSNTFTGPIEVNLGSVYLYPGASGATTVLGGDNQLTLNNSSGAGASYSHFFLLGGRTTISNLTSIGTAPLNTAIANGNPTMGFVVGPATLTINQTANTTFGGTIADTITDNYDSGSDVPGSLSVALTGTKDLTLTGNAAYTGTTTVGAAGTPGLYLAPGASLGDTAVTVNAGSTFGAGPGSHLGDTNSNHSGGNLTLNGGTLDMTAGGAATTIGTFAINQPAASSNNSLTLSSATLDFDATVSGADSIALAGPASVSGTNIINVSMLGTAAAGSAVYNLITAPHGLLGTFEFANGTTTETIPYGSGTLTLSLINTATAEELSISQGASASYYLKLDADGVHVDIWNNTTGTGGYAEQVLRSQSSALTLVASGGAGSITVDNSAGAVYVTGGLTLDGDTSTALKVIGTGNGDSVTANAGQIIFDGNSFSFTGVTTETLDPHGGTDALTVNAGKLMIVADPAGGGIVDRSFSTITIGAAAELQVLSPVSHSDRAVLVVGGLTIAGSTGHWTGLLDLGGNDMDLQTGSITTVSSLVAAGYNFGGVAGWQAEGLSSSAALADTTHLTTLGVIQNNQSGTALYGSGAPFPLFDGTSPGKADILVKFTYFGDATLQGSVSATDYSRIDNGYLTGATGWYNGDFNYDGVVNGSDYTLIDNAFNMQGAGLAAEVAPSAAGATTVNQPVSAAVNPVAKAAAQTSKPAAALADRGSVNGKIGRSAVIPAASWSSSPVVPSWQSIWPSTSDSVADELFAVDASNGGSPFSQSLISV